MQLPCSLEPKHPAPWPTGATWGTVWGSYSCYPGILQGRERAWTSARPSTLLLGWLQEPSSDRPRARGWYTARRKGRLVPHESGGWASRLRAVEFCEYASRNSCLVGGDNPYVIDGTWKAGTSDVACLYIFSVGEGSARARRLGSSFARYDSRAFTRRHDRPGPISPGSPSQLLRGTARKPPAAF